MRIRAFTRFALLAIPALALFSCNEKENFTTEALEEYIPLAEGKYIIYRLDSTVFTNFGRNTEVHSYQLKHEVDTIITDNLGRPSYRIFTSIRDADGLQSWQPAESYFITFTGDQAERVDENNLRFIVMHLPLRDGYSWKGNKFLPANPYNPAYNFSNDDNMADWDFYFDGVPADFTHEGNTYSNVYTIEQADEAYNVPITDPNAYAAITRSVEKYAKEIGLVFRQHELWEYQPNPGGPGGPYKTGFGVTMWMIDHN